MRSGSDDDPSPKFVLRGLRLAFPVRTRRVGIWGLRLHLASLLRDEEAQRTAPRKICADPLQGWWAFGTLGTRRPVEVLRGTLLCTEVPPMLRILGTRRWGPAGIRWTRLPSVNTWLAGARKRIVISRAPGRAPGRSPWRISDGALKFPRRFDESADRPKRRRCF